MGSCEWREKPGAGMLCRVMPNPDEIYCPRHKMMHDAAAAAKSNKVHPTGCEQGAGPAVARASTRRSLLQSGYVFIGTGSCDGCGLPIEWFRTPKLRNAPYDPMPNDWSVARSHFASCKNAAAFRRSA
jgi:hypothetical protein